MMSLLQIFLLHNTRITTIRMVIEVTIEIISFPTKMAMDTNQVEAQMVDQIKDIKIIILNVHNVNYLEKFGHIVISCYHWFDINFQGFTTTNNSNTLHKSGNSNTQMQVMLASPSTTNDEVWFLDTRATYHLT